ncbi:hypothetical protein AeRB84_020741, partial [Aphanomyces euteiches]
MSSRWTADCTAQKVLQQLIDDGLVDGSTEPSEARALAPEVFKDFNNTVFALHIRNTKMSNNLRVTTKRAKGGRRVVERDDGELDIPQLGKRKSTVVPPPQDFEKFDNNSLRNPGYIVAPYYDHRTEESYIGIGLSLMTGVKSGLLEVKAKDPWTLVLTYEWAPGLLSIAKTIKNDSNTSETKHWAKVTAFALAMKALTNKFDNVPTSTQVIDLPQPVVPQKSRFNIAQNAANNEEILMIEFKVQ